MFAETRSMRKCLVLLLLFAGVALPCVAQVNPNDAFFLQQADVDVREIVSLESGNLLYTFFIKQPLDHSNPDLGHFWQRVYYTYRDAEAPTVIVTEGYGRTSNRMYELSELLDANQVIVEHRFFGRSMPEELDYDYLDLYQATADLHHVREVMGEVLTGKWVSTGISKGGATTIFYRYFYPDDVDLSVPYVAPINREFEDRRIYAFLDSVGSDNCRNTIRDFQVRMLKKRDKVLPLLELYNFGARAKYSYWTMEEAFELAVLEYPFSFWQYGHDCRSIPSRKTPLEDAVKYLLTVSDMQFFGDQQIADLASHYFQSAEEMGYYGYETAPFRKYLEALPSDTNPHAAFVPERMDVPFDGTLLDKVNEWLNTDAHQMVYIYGGIDTWSATGVPPNDAVDSEWFILEGKHHANARIAHMLPADRKRFIEALERYLEMEVEEN